MIRTEIIATSEEVSFNIPENYIGKVLEIIAFTKDEGLTDAPVIKKTPKFTVLHTDVKDYKFNRDEANER
ncbi:hypothetical protein BDD43_1798 [Mucilaginibacter gracilis]|uniref:Uncharacterized protein n=1 Tax=Mucilaginibacter gracilis TaxID=423350 RepID=A0A495IZV7_9SPHI|nr:hypothetical protein [Mucilaginibacter gracilis]RKR81648.1 hypothetical protein BDD43_1798 [Mucilaginibacter gracilis]